MLGSQSRRQVALDHIQLAAEVLGQLLDGGPLHADDGPHLFGLRHQAHLLGSRGCGSIGGIFVVIVARLVVQHVLRALHEGLSSAAPLRVCWLLGFAHHHALRHVLQLGVHMHLSPCGGADAAQVLATLPNQPAHSIVRHQDAVNSLNLCCGRGGSCDRRCSIRRGYWSRSRGLTRQGGGWGTGQGQWHLALGDGGADPLNNEVHSLFGTLVWPRNLDHLLSIGHKG
mmetsp:Transcript_26712/g.72197  ORF Transcript_26712/g.72197 Transcript_26712/m.72197 type:complete len:227 (+) Transcript_26712:140-820(+)